MDQCASHLRRISYALLFMSLVFGAVTVLLNARLALLAAAVVFGWSQIGGL